MNKDLVITRDVAAKVLHVVDQGLSHGLGVKEPGKMCVEAAVCFALGLPHSDDPLCVDSAVRAFKIRLNDSDWSSKEARAKGLRRLAIAQLGTKDKSFDGADFAKRLSLFTIRTIVPIALRAAAQVHPYSHHKDELERAARACETAYAADAHKKNEVLSIMAEGAVQILIEMNAAGCAFLDLTEA